MATIKPEEIVHVKGDIINYRGNKQMKVNQIRLATTENQCKDGTICRWCTFITGRNTREISHLYDIENANLQRITRHLLKKYQERFYAYPAASSHNHNFASGLSYHVLTMLRIAKSICDIYPLLNKSLFI